MPSISLITTGDPKGAEIVIKALREVKRKAYETELALGRMGKSKITPSGLPGLESELRRTNSQVNVLSQSMKTAAVSSDKLETEVSQLQAKMKTLTAATGKQTAASSRQIKTNSALRDSTRGVAGALGGLWFAYGQILPLMAGFAVAATFRRGITEGAEFAQQMQFVKGVTGETAQAIERASVSVLSLGESNIRGPIELAQGMRVLTKAGLDLNSALTALVPVTNLSIVGELDIAKATKIAAAAMNAFGKTASDLPNIVDTIGKASIISATEVGDLGNALSFMTGSVGLFKAELPEMSAQLAIAAQRGVTGSKAGTALNRAWLNLAAQAPKTKRALKELGVEVFDDTGQFRKMDAILSELHDGLSQFTSEDQANFIKAIFGVRSIKAIVPVIAEANNRLPKFRTEIAKASEGIGTMGRIVEDLEDSFKGGIQKAASSLSSSLISAFRSAEPAFTSLTEQFDRMFRTTEFKEFASAVMKGFAGMATFVIEHRQLIGSLVKTYLLFKAGGVVSSALMSGFGAIAGSQGLLAVAKASGAASVGVRGLATAALGMIGPAGWVTLGVVGVAALVFWLRKLSKRKRSDFEILAEDIGSNFVNRIDRMKNKVQSLQEELDRLNEVDLVARDRTSLKADLDRLLIAKDAMEARLASIGGQATVEERNYEDIYGIKASRVRQRSSVLRDLELVNSEITKAKKNYGQFLALQTAQGVLKAERDAALARQRGEGSPLDPAATLGTGTKTAEAFDLSALKTAYTTRLAAVNTGLQTEKQLLGAHRAANIVGEEDFVSKSKTLADDAFAARLSTINEFISSAGVAQEKGFDEGGKTQQFMSKLAVDAEKTRNKQILDSRLALIAELGKANKEFAASTKKSEANIVRFSASIAKSQSTDFFGKVDSSQIEKSKIAALEADVGKRRLLVEKHKLAENASEEERLVFIANQSKAKLALHKELETGKTALTKEQEIIRRKETIDGFKSLHSSTSSALGAIADLIGSNTEKSFKRSQRFRIAQAYMDTAAGALGAFADTGGHIAVRIAAAAAAALIGLARVQQIKSQTFSGQAHDGISNIPSTGTYLIEKDERVVKKADNKKLEKFLDSDAAGGSTGGGDAVSLTLNVTAWDGASVNQMLDQYEAKIVGMIQKRYDQRLTPGGPIK